MGATVLIVVDDPPLRAAIVDVLTGAGYRVRLADWSGDWRRRRAGAHALVLETGYPGRRLTRPGIPTLAVDAGVGGQPQFDHHGVDDYLVAPFHPSELLYRVSRLLRDLATPRRPPLVVDNLEIQEDADVVRRGVEVVRLGPRERRVLAVLARTPGRVWPPLELAAAAGIAGGSSRATLPHLRAVIRLLRSKLEPDPSHPRYVLVSRGRGYMLAAPQIFGGSIYR